MGIQPLRRVLLAAAVLAITAVQASPFWAMNVRDLGLSPRDTVVSEQCSELVVGANSSPDVGSVCVTLMGGTLTIKYSIDVLGYTLGTVHAWVGTSAPTTTVPGSSPGQFPYSSDKGSPPVCTLNPAKTMATCTIPIPNPWRGCTGQLYVVAHAEVSGPSGGTAWGKGDCYDSKGNCAKFFPVNRECKCPLEINFHPITTLTTSITTITGTSTSSFLTSTTETYETSSTSTYTTSTTVTYLTSTTREYSTTESSTSTTTSTSIFPKTISFSPTTTTTDCDKSTPFTIITTVSTTLPAP